MNKKQPGIFDPFAPPPKEVPGPPPRTSEDIFSMTVAEESGIEGPRTNIRLDGGSYILELNDLELNDIPKRLGNLIKDIIEKHPGHMTEQGIQLIPRGSTFDTEETERILPTPVGHLVIYVGEDAEGEEPVYRRIAHALMNLPIHDILEEHKARVIVRS